MGIRPGTKEESHGFVSVGVGGRCVHVELVGQGQCGRGFAWCVGWEMGGAMGSDKGGEELVIAVVMPALLNHFWDLITE